MQLPESSLYPEQARALVPPMLDFLAATHDFYIANVQPPYPGFELPGYRDQFNNHMEASRLEVNACLAVIGGLAVRYTDGQTQRSRACVVQEWLGYDTQAPQRMNWSMAGAPANSCVSLEIDAILECRPDIGPQYKHAPRFLDLARTGIPILGEQHHGLAQ